MWRKEELEESCLKVREIKEVESDQQVKEGAIKKGYTCIESVEPKVLQLKKNLCNFQFWS